MDHTGKPVVVIDEAVCRTNIQKMAKKAAEKGLRFRPHFKTHQSAAIGQWFRDAGTSAITVSSVSMARYFAREGWDDITIAFPANIAEMEEINRLAGSIRLNLLADHEETVRFLAGAAESSAGIWIETDTGHHRSGAGTGDLRRIDRLLDILSTNDRLTFKGFLSHTGNTYSARSAGEIREMHTEALQKMCSLKAYYRQWWPNLEISLGDTPSCSVCDNWEGADEIRPGNFVFFDLFQWNLGVCRQEEVAVRVFCPVVSLSPGRREAVVYGGAVHFSKDFLLRSRGKRGYGAVVTHHPETGKPEFRHDFYLAALSQEHGIVRGPAEAIRSLRIGDLLEIVPVHSCLTADLAGHYLTTGGLKIAKMNKTDFF